MLSHGFRSIVRYRWIVTGTWLVLVLSLGALAGTVRRDFSVENYFPRNDPSRQIYEQFKKSFSKEDGQIAAFWRLDGPLDSETYKLLENSAEILRAEGLTDITWIGTAQHLVFGRDQHTVALRPLFATEALSNEALHQALARYKNNPFYQGTLWNDDQRVFVVSGFLGPEQNNDAKRRSIELSLTEKLGALEADARTTELVLSGLPILRARYLRLMERDQAVFLGGGNSAVLPCHVLVLPQLRPGAELTAGHSPRLSDGTVRLGTS